MQNIKQFSLLLLFFVFSISFSSCQKPRVEGIDSIQIKGMDDDGIQALVDVRIYNPKHASFQSKNLKIKLFYKEVELADGTSDEKVMLKARQSTTLPFDINFSLEILEKFGDELLMQDSILVSGKFEGDFTMFDLHKKEDIEYWMKTKDIMDKIYEKFLGNDGLDISKKINSITLSTMRIDLKMNVSNTLSIPMTVKDLNLKIYKDRYFKNDIGICQEKNETKLEKDSSAVIQAELKLSTLGAITSVTTFFHYYLKGYLTVEINKASLKVPIIQHIKVNPFTQDVEIIKD
jgi:LEA14-like dessication related protein